jgi:hypothetical protein
MPLAATYLLYALLSAALSPDRTAEKISLVAATAAFLRSLSLTRG